MSAGTGVRHSEFNPSQTSPTHLLQIWLLPNRRGIAPGYEQRHFSREARKNRLTLLVSPNGRDGSISAQQDAAIYGALLADGGAVEHRLSDGRQAYVHVARGAALINDRAMAAGDAVHLQAETSIRIHGVDDAEVLLFDLP
jgi:hypothetical protein